VIKTRQKTLQKPGRKREEIKRKRLREHGQGEHAAGA